MIKIGEMMMILDFARGLEAPAYGPRKPRQAVIDPFTAYLRERVMRCPGSPAAGFSAN